MNTPNKQAELEKEIEKYNINVKRYTFLLEQRNKNGKIIDELIDLGGEISKFENNVGNIQQAELKGIKEGKAQAISEFKEKLKEALCIDKDEDCKVNCCKTQGGKDNFICKNCNQIEKTAQEITK